VPDNRTNVLRRIPGGSVGLQLAVMALVTAIGTGGFLSISVVFVTRIVGLSAGVLGIGLTVSAAISLGTAVPIGILADRIGPKRVQVGISVWRCACFVAYPFIQNIWQFFAVVCLLGLVEKSAAPMEQALVGRAVPTAERVRVLAALRSMRNVGFTLGAGLGSLGLLIDSRAGYAAILLANATTFAICAVLAARLPVRNATAGSLRRRYSVAVLRDRPFLAFTGVNAVLATHMTLLSIGLPLWIVGRTSVPHVVIAVLLAINTVLAVVFQVTASRGTDTITGSGRALRLGGSALAVCCLLVIVVPHVSTGVAVAVLVVAMVALTAGELLQGAGGSGGSYLLALPGQEGVYHSVYWLNVSLQQIAAPIVVTTVVGVGGGGWVALAAVLGAAGLAAPGIARRAYARITPRVEETAVNPA
jgi:MFS transporter